MERGREEGRKRKIGWERKEGEKSVNRKTDMEAREVRKRGRKDG